MTRSISTHRNSLPAVMFSGSAAVLDFTPCAARYGGRLCFCRKCGNIVTPGRRVCRSCAEQESKLRRIQT